MKITIKTLKQVTFEIEVPSEKSTILDLKKAIEESQNFDADQLKLLHSGVVLENDKTLEEYKIEEGATVIMMNSKVKVKNNDPKAQPQEQKKEEPKQEEKAEEKKPEQKPQENKYASQIASLVDMGFEKSQAEAAIKAARGQVDVAVEFLYNGIPEGIDNNDMQDLLEGQGEGNEEEDPVKKLASVAKIISREDPTKLTNLLQNIQMTDPDLFNEIKEREEEFKTLLEQPVNQQDLINLRSFQQDLGIPGGQGQHEGHEGHGGQGGIRINLTEQDRTVINRLKELGNFNEADVVQAYFACDKNEEMTANYLFEQKMRDDDEMFKNNNNNNNNNNNQ